MTVARQAVLVTGLYGAGKSSLAAEMAERLERADLSFGAVDVDWLAWYHLAPADGPPAGDLGRTNLAHIADRYLSAGITRLILAVAARTDDEVDTLKRLIPCPVTVVRLDAGIDAIERRLALDPTLGRAADLEVAREWARLGLGRVAADLVLDGEDTLAANGERVLTWLGWTAPGGS